MEEKNGCNLQHFFFGLCAHYLCACVCVFPKRWRARGRQRAEKEGPIAAQANLAWTCSPFRLQLSTHLLLLINTTGEEGEKTEREGGGEEEQHIAPLFLWALAAFVSSVQ